jgi:hypothetical protein
MDLSTSWNQAEPTLFNAWQSSTDRLTLQTLGIQNMECRGTGGTSEENRDCGFMPAFLDRQTGSVYLSRFADGRVAPVHLLDGLPAEVVVYRHPSGRVAAVSASIVAGFVRGEQFYTREQAANLTYALRSSMTSTT